eukprot:2277940-Pyramimonas_sp.AAC.1
MARAPRASNMPLASRDLTPSVVNKCRGCRGRLPPVDARFALHVECGILHYMDRIILRLICCGS